MAFSLFSKKYLGIDIGSASIKVVEISASGSKNKLTNYVEFKLPSPRSSLKIFDNENSLVLSDKVPDILTAIFDKGKIKRREATFSVPDFSTFFTVFSLPPMSEKEIAKAVEFESRHYIPLPLSEVVIDWQIVNEDEVSAGQKAKILLVAVPNKILKSYERLAFLAQVKVKGMEAEVFSLARASIPKDKEKIPVCLIDIGSQSTTMSIVENGYIKLSHSYDVSGDKLTEIISKVLKVDMGRAEEIKEEEGLNSQHKEVYRALDLELKPLYLEIERLANDFYQSEGRNINNIILAGGGALLKGLKDYLENHLEKNVYIADPFSKLVFPPVLQERLKEIGPVFSVAVGSALREIKG